MPSLEYMIKMSNECYILPQKLQEDLRGGETVVILDCRSQAEFTKSHIKGAISLTLPSLMLRRLKAGKLSVSCIIQNNEAKETFDKLWKTHTIILYDENSTDINSSPSSISSLLFKKLKQEGSKPTLLKGGFSKFEEEFPEYCVGHDNQAADDDILGLCNLKIAEDSAYGTSESDCDSLNSPPSNFPVQVIPNLYLGNAKNSADLNLLKKCGIHYILNVTPNVPNMFEEDTSFKYMKIPISDHISQNLSRFFPDAISFIDEARESDHGVLVHCLAGISRSVTITVAYLMQKQEMSLNEAYEFVKKCKPNISPNFNFMGQLLDFEKSLGRHLTCGAGSECNCQKSAHIMFQSDPKGSDSCGS